MRKLIFKMILAPALLIVGISFHPALPVYAYDAFGVANRFVVVL